MTIIFLSIVALMIIVGANKRFMAPSIIFALYLLNLQTYNETTIMTMWDIYVLAIFFAGVIPDD